MRIDGLFALRSGGVRLPDGQPATLEMHELGRLRVPSGRLGICDPIWLHAPGVLSIPPGDHRVVATIARVPESYDLKSRPGYLSLVISDRPTTSVHPGVFEEGSFDSQEQAVSDTAGMPGLYGVATSSMSSVAMVDAEAIGSGMPRDPGTWFETVISPTDTPGWFGRMDTELDGPLGSLLTELPEAANGENIAILIARPERLFPVLETRDAQGAITGIHIDLLIIGELSESLNAFDGQNKYAAEFAEEPEAILRRKSEAGSPERRGPFARLKNFFSR